MQIEEAGLDGLKLVRSQVYRDARGWFTETFNQGSFARAGLPEVFAQDNQSFSRHGTLRGLHSQFRQPQGKLVRVLYGVIWDVVVDLRQGSATFGKSFGLELRGIPPTGEATMLWVPEGFAHGFLVLSETAEVLYKVTRPYDPGGEQTLLWNDPALAIAWPLDRLEGGKPLLSAKDAAGLSLTQIEPFQEAFADARSQASSSARATIGR